VPRGVVEMVFQVIPRERVFFDLLERAADNAAVGARELAAMVEDTGEAFSYAGRVRDLEHVGDDLTHEILATLNTTFVTPFDRHDIHHLASAIDDVVDAQEAVADLLVLHEIEEPIPQLRQQTEVLVRATRAVAGAVRGLQAIGDVDLAWADIKRLEHEGDRIYRRAVAELYSGDYRAMDVLKWKDILHEMETAIDRCEDIANIIESIALKQA
jgi:predicted phosphate transport protein (TIGR00153 family)